jgi:hypothetical protein
MLSHGLLLCTFMRGGATRPARFPCSRPSWGSARPARDSWSLPHSRVLVADSTTMVIGQKLQVGLRHAGRIVTIELNDSTVRVLDERDELITVVPRTSTKDLKRHKAYGHSRNRKTG